MADKLPWMKWFPADWLSDEAVRSCSLSARGLWIDMLCLMHKSTRRGYLQQANGQPLSLEQIARSTGCSTEEGARLLRELSDSGVYSTTELGTIFSRRMVKEDTISKLRRKAGKKGGNPVLLNQNSSKQPTKPLASEILEEEIKGKGGGLGEGKEKEKGEKSAPLRAETSAEGLAAAWCFLVTRRRLGIARDSPLDIATEFAEFLRLGYEGGFLLAEIQRDGRDRGEHFWQFKERLKRNQSGKNGERIPTDAERIEAERLRKAKTDAELSGGMTPDEYRTYLDSKKDKKNE